MIVTDNDCNIICLLLKLYLMNQNNDQLDFFEAALKHNLFDDYCQLQAAIAQNDYF